MDQQTPVGGYPSVGITSYGTLGSTSAPNPKVSIRKVSNGFVINNDNLYGVETIALDFDSLINVIRAILHA